MVNTLYTAQQAARSTLAAVRYLTVLPRTVRQDFSAEFVAGRGRTIDVPLPIGVGAARTYTAAQRTARDAIVFDDITQDSKPITLSDQVYKAVRLPDDFATFDLVSLEQQVLRPQAESVVDGLTAPLIAAMEATATDAGVPTLEPDGTNALEVLIAMRKVLNGRNFNGRKAPMNDRFVAVGSNAEAALLSVPQLQKVNEAGDGGDMLRRAVIRNLFGFTIVTDLTLDADTMVGYHRDAFALVTRPSREPEGAAKSATVAQDGFALRWIQHYNPLQLEDQSVVDTFVGADALVEEFAVKTTVSAA
jgi:hypothetical protein